MSTSASLPSRRELVRTLDTFARPNTAHGLLLFGVDILLYVSAIAGVLFVPVQLEKIACSIFAGMALARMFSLAHNAAHENIVQNKKLNRILAVTLFTPIFYNYCLWVYEHHRLHHPNTNDLKPDAYKPFSKVEFDALPRWRSWLERIYRAPNILGFGLYYLLQRHFSTKLVPPAYIPRLLRRSAWKNFAGLCLYGFILLAVLVMAPTFAVNIGSVEAIVLGLLVPFFVFEVHDGFALYVQHTDPRIPWFKGEVDRQGAGRTELLSVHLRVPRLMGWFYHDTFAHPVHHLHPKIPCYRVYEAQLELDQRLGSSAIVSTLNLAWLVDNMRRCKLYDWDTQEWLDFDGVPTSSLTRT